MALLLHRIGRFVFRRAWLVISAWVLALGAVLGAGTGLGGFQAISPFLPLTWAVQGMQLIVAGAGGGAVAAAAGAVALFGGLGAVGTALVVARRRGIRSIGIAATALG